MSADEPTILRFAGRDWSVKRSAGPVGPGPNVFDDSDDAVRVDANGNLVLRMHRACGNWVCAEVVGVDETGYGTYEWTVATTLGGLEPQLVCGMFTWSNEPGHANRELDIEVAHWSDPPGVTGRFVVQPSDYHSFALPRGAPWRCSLVWAPGQVTFRAGDAVAWSLSGPQVPPPGGAHPRLNLWLAGGLPPTLGVPVVVRFASFRFTPG